MAILKIARMGHPVLTTLARPVTDPRHPEIRKLVNDMVETMMDASGAGLAAPQVHVPLRVVIFQAPGERSDPGLSEEERFDHTAPLSVLINPADVAAVADGVLVNAVWAVGQMAARPRESRRAAAGTVLRKREAIWSGASRLAAKSIRSTDRRLHRQ